MGKQGPRVLFVDCAPFPGGAQRSLLGMVEALRDDGIEPYVVSADNSPEGVIATCRGLGIRECRLHTRHWSCSLTGLGQFVRDRQETTRVLRRVIGEWSPVVLHANTVRAALLVPRALARAVPLVVHDRDLRAPRLARYVVAGKARAIVAISRVVAAAWRAGRCVVVPNGLPVEEIAKTEPQARYEGCVALVADFVTWKRHDLFLHAFARVRQQRPEARALLVGRVRSGEREWLAEVHALVARLGLSSSVDVLTDVTCAWPHIAAARALASCAPDEPFGRTVVEALALGKPVVAVRGGGPEEILGESQAGVLVGADADAIAAALLEVWDWSGTPGRAEAARQRAGDFSAARMADRVRGVYRSLLAEPVRA